MRLSINRCCLVLFTIALMSAQTSVAETTFIRDQLNVTVHSIKPNGGISADDTLTTIPSGEAVEVLLREDQYAKIRHKEIEGWIEADMLTKEKPQKIRYLQLLSKFKSINKELKATKAQLGNAKDTEKEAMALGKLNKELTQAKTKITELENQLKNQTAPKQEDQTETTEAAEPAKNATISPAMTPIPAAFAGIGMVICLILGLYLGYSYLDKQIRNRHGGVRIR